MTLDERRLAVFLLLTLTLAFRVIAQHHAGGLLRDQADGLQREPAPWLAAVLRLLSLGTLILVLAWTATGFPLPGSVELPGWAYTVGLGLGEAGLILLVWVHHVLGVHVSGTLHLRDDHRLVEDGPYRRVRHPMYTSFVLLFAGLGLLIGNVPILVFLLSTQVWTIFIRLPAEEASLHAQFGEAWVVYRGRTGRVTPWF